MHIPDHALDPTTCISTGLASAAAVGYAIHQLRRNRTPGSDHRPLLMGLTAAGVFAIQMLNFPVHGGMSAHLTGAVLAGVLLGPWAGIVTVSLVLLVQAVLFQDGGMTALGANVLNMAVVGAGGGFALFQLVKRAVRGHFPERHGSWIGASVAATVCAPVSAMLCSVELALGGTFSVATSLATLLPAHVAIGLGEACITGTVVASLFYLPESSGIRSANGRPLSFRMLLTLLAVITVTAAISAPWASPLPDPLEVALQRGTLAWNSAGPAMTWTPFADYEWSLFPGFASSTSIAALIGTLSAAFLTWGMSRQWLRPANPSAATPIL